MVKRIVLLDKMYNITSRTPERTKNEIINRYKKYLNEQIKGFPNTTTKIKKLREFDKRFELIIYGPEEVFIYNLLKKEIGSILEFQDIKEGRVYKGFLVDVGKVHFGLYVDCAIFNPKGDVLINLYTLREQLCNGKKIPLLEIINRYNFIEHFPVYVKITKIDLTDNKIQGEIDEKTLKIFRKVVNENIEGIFFSGATKNQVKKAIIRKGHLRDIISVERYGFLDNIVLFKENTDAPGIIAHIGKNLRNCKLSAIRPNRIRYK